MHLTPEELATVLAALRYYQSQGFGNPQNRPLDIHEIATSGDQVVSLDDEAIDRLCEKINVEDGGVEDGGPELPHRPACRHPDCDGYVCYQSGSEA